MVQIFDNACSISAIISSTSSIPIDSLIKSSVTPVDSCSSLVSCWCVVDDGVLQGF